MDNRNSSVGWDRVSRTPGHRTQWHAERMRGPIGRPVRRGLLARIVGLFR